MADILRSMADFFCLLDGYPSIESRSRRLSEVPWLDTKKEIRADLCQRMDKAGLHTYITGPAAEKIVEKANIAFNSECLLRSPNPGLFKRKRSCRAL
jgi:hypothetical protein